MKTLFFLILIVTGCAKDFYVQESSKLTKVTVHECSAMTFRNIDTGKLAKREGCRNVIMDGHQKSEWSKLKSGGEKDDFTADVKDTED